MDFEALKELGLSQGQIEVYAAVIECGIANISKIQEKTGIDRRNIYDILDKLIDKGMVSYAIENGKRTYQCTHPNKLLDEIKQKRIALENLEKQVPQILSVFEQVKPEIRAETYRGYEAIKSMLEDILNYKVSYWIGGNSEIEKTPLKRWFQHWMTKRVKKKHIMYDLVDYGTFLEGLPPNDITLHKKSYYKYCSLPKSLASPMVVIIYGNKVAQILWRKQNFAFVLESEDIRISFMKYFNYFWKNP